MSLVHVEQFIRAPDEAPHGPWFRERMRVDWGAATGLSDGCSWR